VLFQLDLGASTSEIYSKSLNVLYDAKLDSFNYLRNIQFNVNNNISKIGKLFVNKDLGGNEQINNKLKLGT